MMFEQNFNREFTTEIHDTKFCLDTGISSHIFMQQNFMAKSETHFCELRLSTSNMISIYFTERTDVSLPQVQFSKIYKIKNRKILKRNIFVSCS